MLFQEPVVKFVPINLSVVTTGEGDSCGPSSSNPQSCDYGPVNSDVELCSCYGGSSDSVVDIDNCPYFEME